MSASHHPDSFQYIFWKQQHKAASLKDARSMKWHPLLIKWCLYLRHLSGSAYETLRETGIVRLPSQRTLRDYTYYTLASTGFSADVDRQLIEIANLATCPEYAKYVILLMDEMHIKEDIVFDKHTGNCDYCHSFQNGIVIVIIFFHIAIIIQEQSRDSSIWATSTRTSLLLRSP